MPGLSRGDWVRLAAAGVAGNTAFHVLLVTGIHRTTAGHAAILVNLSPVVAVLLARLVLREPLGGRRVAGITLALAGVVLVVGREGGGAAAGWLGDLLCLGASVSWALFTVLGKPVLARASPRLVTTWATLIGAAPLVPLGVPGIAAVRWSMLTPGQWLLLGYLSAGTIAGGNLLWYWALARAATARVVSFTYLIPLVGAAMAVALGQEPPTASLVGGGLAVVAGVALAQGGRVRDEPA
jgi:O-acetylserine/cysteine efflux transporter